MDGINDSDVVPPGKLETVMGVLQQEEKDGGGWEVVHSQHKTWDIKAAAGGRGSRTGSLERLFPTILLTHAVAMVEKLIEERGVKRVIRIEEINAARRRRRLENESEEEKRAREIEEENDRWRMEKNLWLLGGDGFYRASFYLFSILYLKRKMNENNRLGTPQHRKNLT